MLGLTLDRATLFYYSTLSGASPERDRGEAIERWKLAVPKGRKPSSQASNSVIGRSRSATPSVAGSTSRSSAPSILTNKIEIINHNHQTTEVVKVKSNLVPSIEIRDDGGLSDNDEMMGEEREVAFASTLKGKEQAASDVRNKYLFRVVK
jgi:hypothetical protein